MPHALTWRHYRLPCLLPALSHHAINMRLRDTPKIHMITPRRLPAPHHLFACRLWRRYAGPPAACWWVRHAICFCHAAPRYFRYLLFIAHIRARCHICYAPPYADAEGACCRHALICWCRHLRYAILLTDHPLIYKTCRCRRRRCLRLLIYYRAQRAYDHERSYATPPARYVCGRWEQRRFIFSLRATSSRDMLPRWRRLIRQGWSIRGCYGAAFARRDDWWAMLIDHAINVAALLTTSGWGFRATIVYSSYHYIFEAGRGHVSVGHYHSRPYHQGPTTYHRQIKYRECQIKWIRSSGIVFVERLPPFNINSADAHEFAILPPIWMHVGHAARLGCPRSSRQSPRHRLVAWSPNRNIAGWLRLFRFFTWISPRSTVFRYFTTGQHHALFTILN